jgi:hypothetical protein
MPSTLGRWARPCAAMSVTGAARTWPRSTSSGRIRIVLPAQASRWPLGVPRRQRDDYPVGDRGTTLGPGVPKTPAKGAKPRGRETGFSPSGRCFRWWCVAHSSGGQGVAGSNPASPTSTTSARPDIRAGQALSLACRAHADAGPVEPHRIYWGTRTHLTMANVGGAECGGVWRHSRSTISAGSLPDAHRAGRDVWPHHLVPPVVNRVCRARSRAFAHRRSIS